LGDPPDAAAHSALAQGRTSDTKPGLILRGGGKEMTKPADCARSLEIAGSKSLLSDLWLGMGFRGTRRKALRRPFLYRHSGMERRVAFCVSHRASRRDAG
jgi:hypothetical protein